MVNEHVKFLLRKRLYLINATLFALFVTFFIASFLYYGFSNHITIVALLLLFLQNILTFSLYAVKLEKLDKLDKIEHEIERNSILGNSESSMLERFAFEIFSLIKDNKMSPGDVRYHIRKRLDRYYNSFKVFRNHDLDPYEITDRAMMLIERIRHKESMRYISFKDFYEDLFHMPYRDYQDNFEPKEFAIRDEMMLDRIDSIISRRIPQSNNSLDTNAILRLIEEKFEKSISSVHENNNNDYVLNAELVTAIKRIASNEEKYEKTDYDRHRAIIKEIFHYMATPLAQMYAALDSLSEWVKNNDCGDKVPHKLKSLHNCYGLIYSILKSYREMSHLDYGNKIDNDLSIMEGVRASFTTYNEQYGGKLSFVENNIPAQIEKYSNNIIIMVLLPLIQNAASYSKQSATVEMSYIDNESYHVFVIKNTTQIMPNIDEMNTGNGYSIKENHKGSGIFIAKNILRTLQTSSLIFSLENGIVETTVRIGRI